MGTFLSDPLNVPWPVVEYLAAQLSIEDASLIKGYSERSMTAHEHRWEIRDVFGYRDFGDGAGGLREFMEGRAWTHAEGPHRLFEQATAWLRRHRVLLPGASVLARLVATVREAAAARGG